MKKVLFLTLFTISLNSMNGQDLDGKWLLKDITVENNKTYPGFHLLEITAEKAVLFIDFEMEKKLELKLVKHRLLFASGKKYGDINFIDNNKIELSTYGTSNNKEAEFILNFYRLLPTKTSLKISEIEKFIYLATDGNKKEIELKFNQELLNIEGINQQKNEFREEMRIEKIDSTLFVSIFHLGKRSVSLPIKEITDEFIEFYFMPTEDMKLTAHRKK